MQTSIHHASRLSRGSSAVGHVHRLEHVNSAAPLDGQARTSRDTKHDLQRRLQGIGTGQLQSGKRLLPGVRSCLIRNRSQQHVFAQHVIPGQARQVLQPANKPRQALILQTHYKTAATTERQSGPQKKMRSSVSMPRSSRGNLDQQSQMLTGTEGIQQLPGEGGVEETTHVTFFERAAQDNQHNINSKSRNIFEGQRVPSRSNLKTIEPKTERSQRAPQILSLKELSRKEEPEAEMPIATPKKLWRNASNPQFQPLNMTPYLKESQESMRTHRLRRPSRSGLAEGFQRGAVQREQALPPQEGGIESKTGFEVIQHRLSVVSQTRERQASQRLLSASCRGRGLSPTFLLAASRSKPLVSQVTGIATMTPLGPAMSSVRSQSRTKIELHQQRHQMQKVLSSNSKRNLQAALEKRAQDMKNGQEQAQQEREKQVLLEKGKDQRFQKLKLKLRNEQQAKKDLAQYMHGMAPSSSRQHILPGQTEAADEAIRQQLLIGRLRLSEQAQAGFDDRANRKFISKIGSKVKEEPRGQIEQDLESNTESMKLSAIGESRDIPQLLSDQASRYSASSKTAARASGKYFGRSRQDQGSLRSSLYALSNMPSEHGLGHIRKNHDYKPHDHLVPEESPQAKGLELFKQQDTQSKPPFLRQFSKGAGASQPSDLIENLITQIQRKSNLGDGYFIYLKQQDPMNPYELVPFGFNGDQIDFGLALGQQQELPDKHEHMQAQSSSKVLQERQIKSQYQKAADTKTSQVEKYYTLSKKGMTTFVQSEPTEFTQIESWLVERAVFRQIAEMKFFKKFKSWKVLKMWRRNILSVRREEVTASLRSKLFIGDPVFGKILMQHRYACKDLEKLRILDFQSMSRDALSIDEVQQRQRSVRDRVENTIRDASDRARDRYRGGISQILDALRVKIHRQDELEQQEEMSATNQNNKLGTTNSKNEYKTLRFIENQDKNKSLNQDPVYEQLGFKNNLNFKARSELREECKRFLRFAFLLDFIALESLSKIFLNSVNDCIDKLQLQVSTPVSFDLEVVRGRGEKEKEQLKKPRQEVDLVPDAEAQVPLFLADCLYREVEIPAQSLYTASIDPFVLPPIGKSRMIDFNPMAHLEIEPEPRDSDDDEAAAQPAHYTAKTEDSFDAQNSKLEVTKVKNIHELWLNVYPDKHVLASLIMETFKLGFDSLKNFERWSMHADLKPYDQVLEHWDYRCYERWEPPQENELYLNCDDWIVENPAYQHLEENVEILINKGMHNVTQQFEQLELILHDYWINQQLGDFSALLHERLKNPVELLPILLKRFVDQKDEFQNFIPAQKDLGLLRVRFNEVRSALAPQPKQSLQKLKGLLPNMVKARLEQIRIWMAEQISQLSSFPTNVDEFVSQIQCLESVEDNYQDVKDQVELNQQIFQVCDGFDLLHRDDKSGKAINEVYQLINTLNNAIYETKDKSDRRKEQMKKKVLKKIPKLNGRLEDIYARVTDRKFVMLPRKSIARDVDPDDPVDNVEANVLDKEGMIEDADVRILLEDLGELDVQMKEIVKKKKNVQIYQKTLDMGRIEPFNNVEEVKSLLSYTMKLWNSIHVWQQNIEVWRVSPFEEVHVDDILAQSARHSKIVLMCERNLPKESTAVQYLKKLVFDFKETMPIVEALGNKHLQEVHWQEIKEILSREDFPLEEKKFSLGELIELDVAASADEIVAVSVTATQESNLQQQLDQLTATWQKLSFDVQKHKDKDALKLVGLDQIQIVLDESMQASSLIVGSRYVKRLQSQAQELQDRLNLTFETLEQWRECQRNWLYLENLFSSPDIRQQRTTDYLAFDVVNKSWTKLMKQAKVKPQLRYHCSGSRQRLNELVKWNNTMDQIQKNLDGYLEEKRELFPRFYFISSDELLQILATATDLKSVEKHVNKCFENINAFILQDEIENEKLNAKEAQRTPAQVQGGQNSKMKSSIKGIQKSPSLAKNTEEIDILELTDIHGMKSLQNEKVKFSRAIKARGGHGYGVEVWMKQLEEQMVQVIKKKIKDAHAKYYSDTSEQNDRKSWVLSHLSQAVAVVDQIIWTDSTEMALHDLLDDNPFAMEDHYAVMKEQLMELTQLIRGDLSAIQRMSLVALITQDVHCRDIVEQLDARGVQNQFDFLWQQQLRYYLEEDQVVIRQVTAQIHYAYEYMGPTSRLVITPLTDKCWITITGAMHVKLGAAPQGPAGTGKTESTKDLAKALGIFCVVTNCSDQIEYKTMAKLFSGVVQSGAWSCLDEFNRINIEVLSVIAQQLLDIKQAKVQELEVFLFNEQIRALKQQCGVFITMNPGYAGRTELPDNLKVLFRPVSMMIPNYGLIAEIMLFAEGFSKAKALSTKMVKLYKLASEQLSQQDHYDFGLRAVKSVLVMAGNLKRAYPELQENIVLIRAMRDSNIPKFLAVDLPLFHALVQDLFPGVEIPTTKHEELEQQIQNSLEKLQLQIVPKQAQKIVQLFETLNVRFGVMIVGPTGGGKTTMYKVLADSMTSLTGASKDPRFQEVKYKVLNPKSISMGELYGEENIDSQEWTDGLASKILRKFAQRRDSERRNWCVFDGPVDALWIENMNTVLDDNMTLCLVNGERIKLNQKIRILFEVQDLAMASPATVSRCGMVYVTPSDLGWRPHFYTWVQNYISEYLEGEKREFLVDLFETFVDLAFEKMKKLRDREVMATNESQNVECLCNFIEHFIKDSRIQQEEKKDVWQKQINSAFAFSLIWGFGASFDDSAHRFLDSIFRDFFGKLHIPPKETVFQYFYQEQEMRFKNWNQMLPEFENRIVAPYDQLFVPTIDSICYTKILSYLLGCNKRTFFTGKTGVGKSIIIQEFLKQHQESQNYASIMLNFSAQTSSVSAQRSIESKLVKKRGKKVIGAKGNQQAVIFIDDINMPLTEKYGAQPPIEFLRLLLDANIVYDRPQFFKKRIESFKVICAAAPPGGGRASLTPRFMRLFHIINIPNASEEILTTIFDTVIKEFLEENLFTDSVRKCGNIAVAATIDMFSQFNKKMLPIPSRFHYLFNMRDISKVFQGILMTQSQSIQDPQTFIKLWLHECQRVFHDRLIDSNDRQFFMDLSLELIRTKFKENWTKEELFETDPEQGKMKVTFSMILKCDLEEKLYEQIQDPRRLQKVLEDKILDYNYTFMHNQMSLIFFEDAVDHICRITRILNQPRGNAMLIGVSGSGKQSLTRLASFLHEAACSQIKLSKNYRPQNFREDLKQMLLDSGCARKSHVFLLADTQIVHEQFLEDINCILNTGEIADLYDKEDLERMEFSLLKYMKEQRISMSQDSIYQTYIKELRLHFHIIMCMSPVGDLLRIRCRNFPSLVSCCTLDWFDDWPEEALRTVSVQFFEHNAMIEGNEELRRSITMMFPKIHHSVQELTVRFYEEQRRRVYITPKTYLDALGLFKDLMEERQQELNSRLTRIKNGIHKLEATNVQIEELQTTLTDLVPKLLEENKSAELQAEQIQKQTIIALERERETENEARTVTQEAQLIQNLKDEADYQVAKAKPALTAAEKAVGALSKDDITELKKVNNPIPAVQLALECTLIYLGYVKYDWKTAQKALADMKFLERLKTYERDSVPDKVLQKVKALTKSPEFSIEKMQKASKAAGGLARWCKAIREYAESVIIVRPLQAQQIKMTEELKVAQEAVQIKQKEVESIKAKLKQLQDDYQNTLDHIQQLKEDKTTCERRLNNASSLLDLLASEGERWRDSVLLITDQIKKVIGNVFMSASQMSYLGPFTGQYRESIIARWTRDCAGLGINLSADHSLAQTLADPIEIRRWGISGLPSDSISIDNAIFTTKSQRWPMLIDPQFQANSWLRRMFKSDPQKAFAVEKVQRGESSSKKSAQLFQNTIENSVRNGGILLLEDLSSEIDPSIDQIVSKAIFKEEGIHKIVLGDRALDYDLNFRLFLTTKLSNPHFLPEVTIKLSVINFTVTFDGLDDQLLAEVVQNLEPEVERKRDQLVIEISASIDDQYSIQSSILTALAESNQETILDNEKLIETLRISKTKSVQIAESLRRSEEVNLTVQDKREQYRSVSTRGSVLYFAIASLAGIDPMYQNSLEYVKKIFTETIKQVVSSKTKANEQSIEQESPVKINNEAEPESKENSTRTLSDRKEANHDLGDIGELLEELLDRITENLYINICRGLFESDKLVYSFLICISIKRNQRLIDETCYNLLLRGQGIFDKSGQPKYKDFKEIQDILTEQQWDLAYCMQLKASKFFSNLIEDLLASHQLLREYVSTDSDVTASLVDELPKFLSHEVPDFEKLLLIKLFKPHQLLQAFREYVVRDLGKIYSVSPLTSMEVLFSSADQVTPIVFVLSQGADPNEEILGYAKKQNLSQKLYRKSLGQGQERAATTLIKEGLENGYWVLLQNCHLFKSWMPQLDNICDQIREDASSIHPSFRLILTSAPVDYFPAAILQNGVKMTTEPPQGLKANLKRVFTNVIDRDVYHAADSNPHGAKRAQVNQELQAKPRNPQQSSFSRSSSNPGTPEINSKDATAKRSREQETPSKSPAPRASLLLDFQRQFDLSKSWKSLLFGLSFFHSIIQERKKFGSIGWNIKYEFNDSDLDTSIKMLENFIFDAEKIPWDSMQFMTGQINYGGRVTDDNDKILLSCLLRNCYGEQILDQESLMASAANRRTTKMAKKKPASKKADFSFFNSKVYKIPDPEQGLEGVHAYIESLPNVDVPEIFGMHTNASISYQQNESKNLLKTMLNLQIQPVVAAKVSTSTAAEGASDKMAEEKKEDGAAETLSAAESQQPSGMNGDDQIVMVIAKELHETRPAALEKDVVAKEIFKLDSNGLLHSFSTVLLQEWERYNKLIQVIHTSLALLIKAIQGMVLMSPELDQMYTSLLTNQVPANWAAVAYSSLKPLASWFKDLHKRVDFIRQWMAKGHPKAYWLSGFFFPHGFLTGVLQAFARKHQKAIDFLKFKFNFMTFRDSTYDDVEESQSFTMTNELALIDEPPKDGVYIYGLHIESAAWSYAEGCITEQEPGVIISEMPMVHFLPFEVKHAVELQPPPPKRGGRDGLEAEDTKSNSSSQQAQDVATKQRGARSRQDTSTTAALPARRRAEPAQPAVLRYEGEEDLDLDNPNCYLCPVYKTTSRAGVLSTTGQSTNYILSVSLPIDVDAHDAEHWTLRGTAVVSMLPD